MSVDLWIEPVLISDGIACLLAIGAGAIGAMLWAYIPERVRRHMAVPSLALAGLGVVAMMAMARYPDWDETEHLHASWLVSQGKLPYRDFWEHHSPLLWIILSPVLRTAPAGAWICDFARLLSLLVSLLAGGLAAVIAQRLHSQMVVMYTAALWMGAVGPAEFYNLRPDLFANVASLLALLLLMRSRSPGRALASGALFGLAVAFTPKHLILLAVLPVVLATERRGLATVLRLTGLQWLGAAVGFAPLLYWLANRGLVDDFVQWVIRFNSDPRLKLGGLLPLIPVILVISWVAHRCPRNWSALGDKERLVIVGLVGAALMMVIQPFHKVVYGLQMFFLLAAAVGAGEARRLFDYLYSARRMATAGVLVAFNFLPTVLMASNWLAPGEYLAGRAEIADIIAAAAGQTVFAVPPQHPIFAFDATDINQPWQWHRWMWKPEIVKRLQGVDKQIVKQRPALLYSTTTDSSLATATAMPVRRLVQYHAISEEEGARLQAFLEENYDLVRLHRHYYWIRADRPLPEAAFVARPASGVEDKERQPRLSSKDLQPGAPKMSIPSRSRIRVGPL